MLTALTALILFGAPAPPTPQPPPPAPGEYWADCTSDADCAKGLSCFRFYYEDQYDYVNPGFCAQECNQYDDDCGEGLVCVPEGYCTDED